jgi:hypothetical protein
MTNSRRLFVAAASSLILVGISAICLLMIDEDWGRVTTIVICYPGILVNGLVTDNFDSAFDSSVQTGITYLVSWVFWAALAYVVLRAAVWLRVP